MADLARTQSITNGQIGQIQDRLATQLRDSGLSSECVQRTLGAPGGMVISDMVATFRRHVEATNDTYELSWGADISKPLDELLNLTGRHVGLPREDIVAMMPRRVGTYGTTVLFKIPRVDDPWLDEEDVAEQYAMRGLEPETLDTLAILCTADRSLGDEIPVTSLWRHPSGSWYHIRVAKFERRSFMVDEYEGAPDFWYAGRRK
ncbi:MAG: hypothetical protein JWL82_419 [Parcubacteria group bacterium]|nr:hypothetical protein [Parcubacteria group bacterium]